MEASGVTARKARRPRRVWQWLIRILPLLMAAAFVFLLFSALKNIEPAEVLAALSRFETQTLLIGLGLAVLVHLAAASYELLGRLHERHELPAGQCLTIGFAAYAISISLSAILGTWALRYRVYARLGLRYRQVTRITLFAISTNWSGFLLLAGLVFLLAPPALPTDWPLGASSLRLVGVAFLLGCAGYLTACFMARGRSWQLRGVKLKLPVPWLAAAQLLLSAAVWATMAAIIHNFMPGELALTSVMAALLLSALGGLFLRLPAGIGVAELVFTTLFGKALGAANVIAALLVYRLVYQLLPLLVACGITMLLEWQARPGKLGRVIN